MQINSHDIDTIALHEKHESSRLCSRFVEKIFLDRYRKRIEHFRVERRRGRGEGREGEAEINEIQDSSTGGEGGKLKVAVVTSFHELFIVAGDDFLVKCWRGTAGAARL